MSAINSANGFSMSGQTAQKSRDSAKRDTLKWLDGIKLDWFLAYHKQYQDCLKNIYVVFSGKFFRKMFTTAKIWYVDGTLQNQLQQ